ncbi:hypothetical protein KJ628_01510, partial [Patescibacteria group bacterium]|nr:hypothetical protein [Patescibacteria group bacterium]
MSDAEHALIQEKLIKEKIDELLRLLSSEDIFTSDDFLQRVADMQAQISVGNHPEEAGRRITATADRDFYSQALDAIKTQFTLYFERAEVIYSRLNIANRDQLAEEAARVGAVLNAQPNALNHQEESFAVLTAIRRYESEFLQQEQEEVESENRWFLGFWNDYKNFATKRSETDFNESQFFSQTTLELQRKGWQGLDEELLRDLFDQTVEIEELIEVARNTFADLTLEDFESIEESLEELHNSTQPTKTGIAETRVLYNRLLMKYQALKKAWLVNIDANFIEGAKKQGLRPNQLEKYEDYLDSLEALENNLRTLVTNDARAQSLGSISVVQKKYLNELYETVIENNRLLNVFQSKIPEQDLLRLNELYDRITSEAEILLGVQLDELESIFTDDVEWWLFAYHGEQWRRTQRLWQQYQAGNVEALILFDKLTIEELISYFSAEIQDLDENDVAYNQRFIALDIQLNRLQKMHSAMKEATDKKAADATPATAEGLGELDSDDKVLSWGDYDLDKSVGQWTIEECASFLTNSRQLAKEQKGQGSSIYSQFEKLRGQLERKEDQQFWTVFSAMYDIAIAYESSADDYSINQGKFFAEDIQAGTKRVERATFMRGLTYHPVFGDHVLNTHKVIKEILLGEEDDYGSIAATNGSLCASKLNVSKVEDVFPNKVREKFEAEYGIKVGSEEYPEHAFQAAYLYGKVFDFRHTAYLEAAKRAVTRNFGGEDPSWYDNPYAVLSYYLVRYAMIPDSKALLLLLVNVEESAQDERDKDLPLPADWIRGDEDEGRPRKVERI